MERLLNDHISSHTTIKRVQRNTGESKARSNIEESGQGRLWLTP